MICNLKWCENGLWSLVRMNFSDDHAWSCDGTLVKSKKPRSISTIHQLSEHPIAATIEMSILQWKFQAVAAHVMLIFAEGISIADI